MSLHILADHSPIEPHHLLGYYLENPQGGRVAKTFVNCGNDATAAMNNALLFSAAKDLQAALIKAEFFIRGFEDDETQEGITELLTEIRSAIDEASPL